MGVLVIGRRPPLIISTTSAVPLAGAFRGGPKVMTVESGDRHGRRVPGAARGSPRNGVGFC